MAALPLATATAPALAEDDAAAPAGRAAPGLAALTDEALVLRFRDGDEAAFDALVGRYQRPLFYFFTRYVADRDTAGDLVQQTLLRVFQKGDSFRGDASFRTWLYRVAANLALSHLRLARPRDLDDPAPAEAPSSHDLLERAQQGARLREAVARLPPRQRLTLELRVYEGLAFREIAAALGASEGSVKVNYHHAVVKLKQWLGGSEP